ncbi:exosome complex component RRP40 [Geosmithia morbida]|uniref:Ribosomal RNA-processing protein 40 n=1 Tax=Geosmithia morbida TaxID=1094350 RepID=A0A9P4Z0W6_9HYPO|nr:exosome complex component RRP40 [Geosmithia morbida]KAF4124574.1 exosome complex component RRP40 [Geosmithia morbida]
MSSEPIFVLPGDEIDPSLVPSHPKKALRLGPGLRHAPPNDVIPTLAGRLVTDHQKNAIRVETYSGRYTPRVGELVIGIVRHSAAESFVVSLSDHTSPALLPHLSFESASKKTRPQLASGALVYARVSMADRHMDAELECVHPSTGKSEGLGPLVGGMLFPISLGMARRLMLSPAAAARQPGSAVVVLEELASAGLQFETAVGRNGRIWVDSESAKTVVIVGRAVRETDERALTVDDQRKLARKLLRDTS